VKRIANKDRELKYLSTGLAIASSTAMQSQDLTLVPQDDTDTGRDGDRLTLKTIHLKFSLIKNLSSLATSEYIRVFVFQWKPNTTNLAPTTAQLFLNDPVSGGISCRSNWIVDNKGQFTVLYDRMFRMQGLVATASASIAQWHTKRLYKRFNKTLQYNAGTTAGSGHIFFGTISDQAVNGITGALNAIIRFTDS